MHRHYELDSALGDASSPALCTVTNPYDESEVGTVRRAGKVHVEHALASAQELFARRDGWIPLHGRIEILRRTADQMAGQIDELAMLAASEGGKPLIDSRVEVRRAVEGVRLAAEVAGANQGDLIALGSNEMTSGRVGFTKTEPIGPVVAVSAFNHPLNLIVHQVAPALAAGCPVIVKPAEATPLSCFRFIELLREAGLPDRWAVPLVTDSTETSGQLVTDPRVAFFSFIGSARVGWMLRSQLAPGTRCALEHGGAAPVLLHDDADWDRAIGSLTKGGFYHAGQVCVSVQRIFVPRAKARDFAAAIAESATSLIIGDPTAEQTDVGPLIRPTEVERIHQWVGEAIDGGAEKLTGGQTLANHCYAATVLLDPPAEAKVSTQEIFGPVVCVYGYDSREEAIRQANSLPYAFQGAVFGQDIDAAFESAEQLAGSAIMINDHSAFRDDVMPFAGLRQSGLGIGGIPYTLHDMQVRKLYVHKRG